MATNNGQFKPGQSGNPAGRPKNSGMLQAYARQHYVEAIDTLLELMRGKKVPAAARAAACIAVLDRGFGRPTQSIEASLNRRSAEEMTDEELLAIAAGATDDDAPPTDGRLN